MLTELYIKKYIYIYILSTFVYVQSMTFVQRRNRLTTHFSESIPVVVKRRMTVYCDTDTDIKRKYSRRRVETFACEERNTEPISNWQTAFQLNMINQAAESSQNVITNTRNTTPASVVARGLIPYGIYRLFPSSHSISLSYPHPLFFTFLSANFVLSHP